MATKKNAALAATTPVVVAAEPVLDKAGMTPKVRPKAPPATKAAAAKAAPKKVPQPAAGRPAKVKPVEAQVEASKAALAAALEKAKAVKLTPRTAVPAKVGKAGKTEKPPKAEKVRKVKLVRDSFTMPENEYAALGALKKRLQAAGAAAKKSELLRAGIAMLVALRESELVAALGRVEKIKTGRPAKPGK